MPSSRAPDFQLWGDSPREQFEAILNNRAKGGGSSDGLPVRTRGFVVLARNTDSLQAVEEWCLAQSFNDCLSARYRITSRPVFGTILAALAEDAGMFGGIGSSAPALRGANGHGTVRFKHGSQWPRLLDEWVSDPRTTKQRQLVSEAFGGTSGMLDKRAVQGLLALASGAELRTGLRLVLLAEVSGEPDPLEWENALPLFGSLPERTGLVLCGAPEEFELPDEHDHHYLEMDLAGVEAEPGPEAYIYKLGALASDRPSEDADWLGFGPYASALARLIRHPGTGPLTIAVHGPWGKGKSQFMQLVRKALEEAGDAPTEEVKSLVVDFNAWRFQDSTQIWAGLASTVSGALESELPWYRRVATPFAYAWRRHRAELIFEFFVPVAVALLALTALAVLGVDRLQDQLASNEIARFLSAAIPTVGAFLGALWVLYSRTQRVLSPISDRMIAYGRRPDYSERMGYQHEVLKELQFVVKRLRGKKDEPRIVVMIDDLDRCPDDKIMELLQAVNLILGESNFYVVLGIDTAMIYRAIEVHYGADGIPLPPRFPERYLRKIIQLPFHLPEIDPRERSSFVAQLFSESARESVPVETLDVVDAGNVDLTALQWDINALTRPVVRVQQRPVEDTPVELAAFFRFEEYLQDNPRELKRLVNVHRFVKIVLQEEGRPPSTDIQRKLVAWLIFCARWPELMDDVLDHAGRAPTTSDNCILQAVDNANTQAKVFAESLSGDFRLSSSDLQPGGPLAKAASIAHLIIWDDEKPLSAEQPDETAGRSETETTEAPKS